jgi:hypothetical protein
VRGAIAERGAEFMDDAAIGGKRETLVGESVDG